MKRNFTFSKYRIKDQKLNLNFIDTFNNGNQKDYPKINLPRNNSLKNKIKILPNVKIENNENENKNNKFSNIQNNNNFFYDSNQNENKKIKIYKNDINNIAINTKKQDIGIKKKKIKLSIPINKPQVKPIQNLNQNYVININNNINNNYQIKMHNNTELNTNKNIKNNNYDFAKMKIVQSEEVNKNNNSSIQKTVLTEISDLSCFKTNKKFSNLNSVNSFVENNDNVLLSLSGDTNFENNLKNNFLQGKQNNKNNNKKIKKIYINPEEFKMFCKEIEEKLNL